MTNLLETLAILQTEISVYKPTNIVKLVEIITTIFRLSVPVSI